MINIPNGDFGMSTTIMALAPTDKELFLAEKEKYHREASKAYKDASIIYPSLISQSIFHDSEAEDMDGDE